MASFDFDSLSDAARKVFLAGVGAIAVGAEKTADVVNDLVEKGELTVEQGDAVSDNAPVCLQLFFTGASGTYASAEP